MTQGSTNGRRILVVRAGALGDTLMATPVARALRRAYPEAAIDWLSSAAAAPLLQFNPHISRVLPLIHRNFPWALSPEKQRLSRRIRDSGYDSAVLLETADGFRQLLDRAGLERIRSFRDIRFDAGQHMTVTNLRVAGMEEFASLDMDLDMDLVIGPQEKDAAKVLLADGEERSGGGARPRIGIHAGYGPLTKKKNQSLRLRGWAMGNFEELGKMLAASAARLVLTGSVEDRDEAEKIAARLPAGSVLQLAGQTTVGELAAVIGALDLLISVDSGPAHMAAALGTPLVVLWGPGILEQTRPISSRSAVRIVRHTVACAPCYGTPLMKTCQRNICMEGITPAEVFREVETLLGARL